ncbi:MAG: T9SS type A sorting domain-containing protein [Bacteroidetes bacterium]|nr:T9SS type A sorting domain-containing protein [Bacteroidota bacterium]
MIKKVLLLSTALVCGIVAFVGIQPAISNTSGSPIGRSGAPGDNNGGTCTGCHSGTPSNQQGIITHNIPATGYTPGSTYQITATFAASNSIKYGFQATPQDGNGTQVGSFTATNATETQTQSSGKYITHRAAGTSAPSNTKTWTWNWTAPASASGPVTIYGAFNATNNQTNSSGDLVTLSNTGPIQPDLSSVTEAPELAALVVYPVPAQTEITVNAGRSFGATTLTLISLDGRRVNEIKFDEFTNSGTSIDISTLPQGVYFLQFESDGKTAIRRFMKMN